MDSKNLIKYIEDTPINEAGRHEFVITDTFEYAENMAVCIGVQDIPQQIIKYGEKNIDLDGIKAKNIPIEKRLTINAVNEGGHNGTEVDLLTLLKWIKRDNPELWDEI